MASIPDADLTGVYCRKSKKGDKQQITVNRQKRLALQDCEKLGLTVNPQNIFIDNGASAWLRNRRRPGWDALLQAARRGEIKHIVCYHLTGLCASQGTWRNCSRSPMSTGSRCMAG